MNLKNTIIFSLIIFAVSINASAGEILSLDECLSLGIENSNEIKQIKYDLMLALEAENQILSQYEPIVNFSLSTMADDSFIAGTYTQTDTFDAGYKKMIQKSGGFLGLNFKNSKSPSPLGPALAMFGAEDNPFSSSVNLSYSQPLWKNFKGKNNKTSIKMVQLQKDIAQISLELKTNILENTISNAYWNLAFAKKSLELSELSLERARKLLKTNRSKFNDGLLEEVDIIAIEASITIREAAILLSMDMVENAKDNLKNIINLQQADRVSFSLDYSTQTVYTEINEDQSIKAALDNRPEIKLQNLVINIKSFDIGIKENERLPVLDVVTRLGLEGTGQDLGSGLSQMTSLDNKSWYIGLNMELFPHKKRVKSAFNQSKYNHRKSVVDLKTLKSNITIQCKAAVRRVNTQVIYVNAAEKAVGLQEKKLKLEGIKFNQGRSSSQFILNYQEDLSRAETEYFKALTDYFKALADLKMVRVKD